MTDSSASPFSLRDLCSGLYDFPDRADMYQDGDSLVECALGGGPALTLVEMALELRLNPRARRSVAELKQDWPTRGSKQWLPRFVPALPLHAGASKADESGRSGPQLRGYDNIDQGIAA